MGDLPDAEFKARVERIATEHKPLLDRLARSGDCLACAGVADGMGCEQHRWVAPEVAARNEWEILCDLLSERLVEEKAENRRLRLLVAELVERKRVALFERTGWFISPRGIVGRGRSCEGDEPLWRKTI